MASTTSPSTSSASPLTATTVETTNPIASTPPLDFNHHNLDLNPYEDPCSKFTPELFIGDNYQT